MKQTTCKRFLGIVAMAIISVGFAVADNNENTCPVRAPFSKGVNLSQWFECDNARSVNFSYFTQETFENLKDMGADVIRLPIHFENLSDGAPNYTIDATIFSYLDQVVAWAEKLGLYLIIDNHSFDSAHDTPRDIEKRLLCIWPQIATRYRDCSDHIMYEVLNEPHGISISKWGKIQGKVIDCIREIDTRHTIIVGGAEWNSYNTLDALPNYKDTNLIYTYHFYDPMMFTHQGAEWTDWKTLTHVPFPYRKESMPPCPSSLSATWAKDAYRNYTSGKPGSMGTVESLNNTLSKVVKFSQKRNAPVFCGEFGVYMLYADNKERAAWYTEVRTILERMNIAWTSWDYFGGFGLFTLPSGGIYPNDINRTITTALGFTPSTTNKPQKPFTLPLSLYKDGLLRNNVSVDRSWGNGYIYVNQPITSTTRSIEWGNGERYSALTFRFRPSANLQTFIQKDAAVRITVRANFAGKTIQLRFKNPDTGTAIPWRACVDLLCTDEPKADVTMSSTTGLPQYTIPNDGAFHTITIPLAVFRETGGWKNSEQKWYPSKNAFNWQNIECLEFSAEHTDLKEKSLYVSDVILIP